MSLGVPEPMNDLVTFEKEGAVAFLRIANPPVNAISPELTRQLIAAFTQFEQWPDATCLVIYGAGRTFVAGGDIASFDSPGFDPSSFNSFLGRMEASRRPVIAALHGHILGGGLELAMACHYRVASPEAHLGLPEVKLGLIPGSMGTQRLPRLVGVEKALDMILTGRPASADEALSLGLIDRVLEGAPRDIGATFAGYLTGSDAVIRRSGDIALALDGASTAAIEKARAAAAGKASYPALAAAVRCVEAAATMTFAEGSRLEASEFETLRLSSSSKALRYLFFASRDALKVPGATSAATGPDIRKIGILGAGTMGGGIAMNFANIGLPVTIVEQSEEALARGLDLVEKNYLASVTKGKLPMEEARRRIALLSGSTDFNALADCDLVIEAVFEDMDVKMDVARRLGEVCRPDAIVATNTSTLDVNVIAKAFGRPDRFLGMHFFSPANVMRLLEIVRGDATAPDVLQAAMTMARRIGKTPVVSGVCYGFIGNRMLEPYLREAEFLLLEGATPAQVDRAIEGLGMAMGPFRMMDMAGVDVGARVVTARAAEGGLPDDPSYRASVLRLFELGRFGQKSQAGYYRYEGRMAVPDPLVSDLLDELASRHGVRRRSGIPEQEIVERLIYPLVNEGALILDEGIAARMGDIDVVWTAGYGFPDYRGGPMFMAEHEIGFDRIVDRLDHYASVRGNAFGYWDVAPLLRDRTH